MRTLALGNQGFLWEQQKAPQCSDLLGGGSPMPIGWIVTTKSPPGLPGEQGITQVQLTNSPILVVRWSALCVEPVVPG